MQFTVENNQLRLQSSAARRAIRSELPALLGRIGSEIEAGMRRDFSAKSAGQTVEGVTWTPDTAATVAGRVRKSAAGRRLILEKHRLGQQIRETRGPGSRQKIELLRQQIAAVSARLKALIAAAQKRVQIGVQSGALESSLDSIVGHGKNGADGVTVGFGGALGSDYQYPFDAARQLAGRELPPELQATVERQVHDQYESILQRELA